MTPLDAETCWEAVRTRDKSYDGAFFTAVRTTKIYCRPGCASRTPLRENVEFYSAPAAAEAAGFRACKRCRPTESAPRDPAAQLAQAVAEHICAHINQPDSLSLQALGAQFGYDPQHIQRTFKAVLGVTPKQYAEAVRVKTFKSRLRAGEPVLEAALSAGYASPSHIYDKIADPLGMTPTAYRTGGKGVDMTYTTLDSPFGTLMLAATERGVCAVRLYEDADAAASDLRAEYPHASVSAGDSRLEAWGAHILAHVIEGAPLDIPLDIQATVFQWRVWTALQAIPRGQTRTYQEVATALDMPSGARAVASACAANRAALVIPCHRVVGSNGALTGYRWGVGRKKALLQSERDEKNRL